MTAGSARPRTHLFTVRVWLEDLGENGCEWRGRVQHAASGEVRYFREWTTLADHLMAMLPPAGSKRERSAEGELTFPYFCGQGVNLTSCLWW